MKKCLLLMVTLCMLFTTVDALADLVKLTETSGRFDLELNLTEGAVLKQELVHDNLSLISITFADPKMPMYKVTVAYGEEAGEKTMFDWTDEELEGLYSTIANGLENPTYEMLEQKDGRKVMIVNEESAYDYAYLLTVYQGYYIQVYVAHADYKTLTQEEIDAAAAMMDQIKILPTAGN